MANIQFELHPPVFTLHRVWAPNNGIELGLVHPGSPAQVFMCSSSYGVQDFLRKAKWRAGIPLDRKVRLWRIPRKLPAGDIRASKPSTLSTPPDSPEQSGGATDPNNPQDSWNGLLISSSEFRKLQQGSDREELKVKDQTNDPNYNGRSTLAYFSLTVDQAVVLTTSRSTATSGCLRTGPWARSSAVARRRP